MDRFKREKGDATPEDARAMMVDADYLACENVEVYVVTANGKAAKLGTRAVSR